VKGHAVTRSTVASIFTFNVLNSGISADDLVPVAEDLDRMARTPSKRLCFFLRASMLG
jgi:hypothetical protein